MANWSMKGHPGRTIAMPESARKMMSATGKSGDYDSGVWKRNRIPIGVDIALGLLFFMVAKLTDLTTAALVGAGRGSGVAGRPTPHEDRPAGRSCTVRDRAVAAVCGIRAGVPERRGGEVPHHRDRAGQRRAVLRRWRNGRQTPFQTADALPALHRYRPGPPRPRHGRSWRGHGAGEPGRRAMDFDRHLAVLFHFRGFPGHHGADHPECSAMPAARRGASGCRAIGPPKRAGKPQTNEVPIRPRSHSTRRTRRVTR